VYVVAIGTEIGLSADAPPPEVAPTTFVLKPPAPPPAPPELPLGDIQPPAPPPAITRYSTVKGAPPDAAKIPKGINITKLLVYVFKIYGGH